MCQVKMNFNPFLAQNYIPYQTYTVVQFLYAVREHFHSKAFVYLECYTLFQETCEIRQTILDHEYLNHNPVDDTQQYLVIQKILIDQHPQKASEVILMKPRQRQVPHLPFTQLSPFEFVLLLVYVIKWKFFLVMLVTTWTKLQRRSMTLFKSLDKSLFQSSAKHFHLQLISFWRYMSYITQINVWVMST